MYRDGRVPTMARRGDTVSPSRPGDTDIMKRASGPVARKLEDGAQAAEGRFVERERAAIERGEIDHDGKAEAGAGLRLVESPPALEHVLPSPVRQARPVIVDRDAHHRPVAVPDRLGRHLHPGPRPLAGVVDKVADHVLEILALAAKARAR